MVYCLIELLDKAVTDLYSNKNSICLLFTELEDKVGGCYKCLYLHSLLLKISLKSFSQLFPINGSFVFYPVERVSLSSGVDGNSQEQLDEELLASN